MLVRQSELRRKQKRKSEAYKLRLRAEAAAAPRVYTKPVAEKAAAEAKPKAAPRKKKVEEPIAKVEETPTEE